MSIASWRVEQGHVLEVLRGLPSSSVHCIVTSPPYWGLRDYGVAGQLGAEPTPDAYVAALVDVFDEAMRVLRDDGTLWLNLGDSYANDGKWGGSTSGKHAAGLRGRTGVGRGKRSTGLKPKDLVGIPWLVAFALRDAGWYLRNDNVWNKPDPMPESTRDRATRSHEYVFMFSKSAHYFYDGFAVAEPATCPTGPGNIRPTRSPFGEDGTNGHTYGSLHKIGPRATRNARTVWTITTAGFDEAHFATFPEALPERCIKAGTSERGACPDCGAPWRRLVEKREPLEAHRQACGADASGEYHGQAQKPFDDVGVQNASAVKARILEGMRERVTVGWEPTCACDVGGIPMDSFDIIASPASDDEKADDPSLQVGRAGFSRPRSVDEGTRPMTRYEQRAYARQLRRSPHRPTIESMTGTEAFKHYIRTDRAGARPLPAAVLDDCIAKGWLERVTVPARNPKPPVPCVVLDIFCGSGTTGVVALNLGRSFVGIELNPEYREMSRRRIAGAAPSLFAAEVPA